MAIILDGKQTAKKITDELKLKVQQQWQLGNINTIQKILTDTPYINQ